MKIAIVEDHVMFREILRKICARDLGHKVVGEAGDGREAAELVKRTAPDLVLLDLHLPNLDGFAVLEAIRQVAPHTKALVLSSHCDDYTVFRAEHLCVQGFVDKNTSAVGALKQAIAAVQEGRTYFSEAFRRVRASRRANPHSFDKLLTDRERMVLALVGLSLSDAEIAHRLGISVGTVEKHRFNLMGKLGLRGTPEVVRYALDHGFTLGVALPDGRAMLP